MAALCALGGVLMISSNRALAVRTVPRPVALAAADAPWSGLTLVAIALVPPSETARVMPPELFPTVAPHSVATIDPLVTARAQSPNAAQSVTARAPIAGRLASHPKPIVAKPVAVASTGPGTGDVQPAEPTGDMNPAGHDRGLGAYRLSWGTARLREDPNRDDARGPAWNFDADASSR